MTLATQNSICYPISDISAFLQFPRAAAYEVRGEMRDSLRERLEVTTLFRECHLRRRRRPYIRRHAMKCHPGRRQWPGMARHGFQGGELFGASQPQCHWSRPEPCRSHARSRCDKKRRNLHAGPGDIRPPAATRLQDAGSTNTSGSQRPRSSRDRGGFHSQKYCFVNYYKTFFFTHLYPAPF